MILMSQWWAAFGSGLACGLSLANAVWLVAWIATRVNRRTDQGAGTGEGGMPDAFHPTAPPADEGNKPVLAASMTLRDWFAGQALHDFVTNPDLKTDRVDWFCDYAARRAYALADAMMKERSKGGRS